MDVQRPQRRISRMEHVLIWIFLAVLLVCVTFVWFCIRYLQPYEKPGKVIEIKDYETKPGESEQSLDDTIAEIMGDWLND